MKSLISQTLFLRTDKSLLSNQVLSNLVGFLSLTTMGPITNENTHPEPHAIRTLSLSNVLYLFILFPK